MPLVGGAVVAALGIWVGDGMPPCPGDGFLRAVACGAAVGCLWALGVPGRAVVLGSVFVGFGMLHYARQVMAPGRWFAEMLPPREWAAFELCGYVLEQPAAVRVSGREPAWRFSCRLDSARPVGEGVGEENAFGAGAGACVWVRWRGDPPPSGARVWMRAAVHRIEPARNPGQWDAAAFFARKGVWAEAQLRGALDGAVLEWPAGFHWGVWLGRMREKLVRELGRGLEQKPVEHALAASMVLGLQEEGLEQEQEWFRHTGTLHLFAVSGLNLAMLASFLLAVARVFLVPPRVAFVGVVPVLVLYSGVTGGSASCVRALVMSVLGLLVCWAGRPAVAVNSLAAAALGLLAWDGNLLFRSGFQLSFWMVLVLAGISGPIQRWVRRWGEPDALLPRAYWGKGDWVRARVWWGLADALAVSLAAWGAGLPAAVLLFYEITPVSVLANLLLMPLAFIVLALGFIALFASGLGWFFTPLEELTPALNRLNAHCAQGVLSIVRVCSGLPGAHWALGDTLRRVPDFTVLDMGQGAAVLVRSGRRAFLLDCGREEQVRAIVQPALRVYGIGALEGLVLSHGDVNHVGGGRILLGETPVRCVLVPVLQDRSAARRQVEEWLWNHPGIPISRVGAGWQADLEGGCRLEVLYPPPDLRASLADDKGLVVRWSCPGGSLLYTADAGFPTELWLLRNCPERLASDVWVRGRHARETTGMEDFVCAVSPRVIVVGDSGGFPRRTGPEGGAGATRGSAVFFQAKTGAVEGFWTEGGCRVRGFCGGSARVEVCGGRGASAQGGQKP